MKKLLINIITFFSLYKFFFSISQECNENSKDIISCLCKNNKTIFIYNNESKLYECTHTLNKGEFATDDHLSFVKYEYASDDSLIMEYNSSSDEVICFPQSDNKVTYEPATTDVLGNKYNRITCIPNVISNETNRLIRRLDDNALKSECINNSNILSCQNLANKCTLEFISGNYNENSINSYCYFIENNKNVPTLFPTENAENYLKDENVFQFEVTYDKRYHELYVNQFDLYIAIYDVNGVFKGMEKLEDKFIFCSNSYNAASNFSMFGNDVLIDCLIDKNNIKYEDHFFEIFLNNSKPNENIALISIPILVDNYQNQNEKDMKDWKLINRMFLSHENYYAKKIKFIVELINSKVHLLARF